MKTIKCTYKSNAYEYTLTVIFTDDSVKYQQKYFDKWEVIGEEVEECSGVCLRHPMSIEEYVIIYEYDSLTDSTLSHEIQHLSCFLLDDRNIGLKGEHQDYEPLCWVNGELNEVIRKMIQDKKIPMVASKYTYGK